MCIYRKDKITAIDAALIKLEAVSSFDAIDDGFTANKVSINAVK